MAEPTSQPQGGERRALVQGDHHNGYVGGYVDWWEHETAWAEHAFRYGKEQDAEAINARGGFSLGELTDLLGHAPTTWRKRHNGGPS